MLFKEIYYLPDELIDIIKKFIEEKDWKYNIFMIKKHLKYENNPKVNNFEHSKPETESRLKHAKKLEVNNFDYDDEKKYKKYKKHKKLSHKEYLLSKIKKKYKPKYKKIINNYDRKLEIIEEFTKENTCLKCETIETCDEPFVDFCFKCSDYFSHYEYYYISSWNNSWNENYYDYYDYYDCCPRYCFY